MGAVARLGMVCDYVCVGERAGELEWGGLTRQFRLFVPPALCEAGAGGQVTSSPRPLTDEVRGPAHAWNDMECVY